MGDQGLVLVQFQSEDFPQERSQFRFDLFCLGFRPYEPEDLVVGITAVPQPPVSGVRRVMRGELAQLLCQVAGCFPVSSLPRVRLPCRQPVIFRVVPAALTLRVLRDQFLLDEFVELVQVDVTEYG
jgi:hypothetical protein